MSGVVSDIQSFLVLDICYTEFISGREIGMLLGIPLGKQLHGRLRTKWNEKTEVALRNMCYEFH